MIQVYKTIALNSFQGYLKWAHPYIDFERVWHSKQVSCMNLSCKKGKCRVVFTNRCSDWWWKWTIANDWSNDCWAEIQSKNVTVNDCR